jgi:hypothetical protein
MVGSKSPNKGFLGDIFSIAKIMGESYGQPVYLAIVIAIELVKKFRKIFRQAHRLFL